jgi:vesicle-fusing ATPase
MAGNLFGRGPKPGREQNPYGQPALPPRDMPQDSRMGGYDDPRGSYGSGARGPPSYGGGGVPQRTSVGRQAPPAGGVARQLRPAKVEDKNLADQYIYGNM